VPSIQNQHNKNFEIIFACHPNSSATILEELGNFGSTIVCSIDQWFKSIKVPAIISRLDSDDALHMHYTKYVQDYFRDKNEDCIFDVVPAFYLVDSGKAGIFKKPYPTQFLSMLSTSHKHYCCSREHGAMKKVCSNYYQQDDFYGALHIIHGKNLTDKNKMFTNFKDINLEDYGIKNG
jgi:hypothetical protein